MNSEQLNCEDGTCEVSTATSDLSEMSIKKIATTTHKLLYFGDPMCSWCWGITYHLDKLKNELASQMEFELILGGLRPGGGEDWTDDFREMIRSHWEHVEKATGQPFDYRFFNRDDFNYDTEPAARAVRVIRDISPELEWPFYKALQYAFYAANQDVHDLKTYEAICNQLMIDYPTFEALFLSAGYKQLVTQDFMRSQKLGVRGFPAVVIQKGEEYYAVSMGYSNYATMRLNVDKIMEINKIA